MEQEHLLILELIEEGKITVPEALHLIEALEAAPPDDDAPDEPTLTVQLYLN